jgi:ABC-type sugar transport system permease subunit
MSAGTHAERVAHAAWRRRTDMTLRVIAAVPLGYAVGSLWAMALARLLPGDRIEATVTATLVSFAICAVAAMWSFFARSGWRAVWTLTLLGAIPAAITWLSIAATGRL